MFILSYFYIIVNIKALLPFIICKASYFFDFLINAPYFIKLKRDPPRYKKDPLTYLYIKLLFAELIKLVYDKLRIYRDTPQGILLVNFRTSPRVVHKRSSSIILSYVQLLTR